jgi:hypothetical protein
LTAIAADGNIPLSPIAAAQIKAEGRASMIELNRDKMKNAVSRCRQVRPLVAAVSVEGREYLVESSNGQTMYPVRLSVGEGNRRFADCACRAGRSGLACYHVAAAVALHVGLMRLRRN